MAITNLIEFTVMIVALENQVQFDSINRVEPGEAGDLYLGSIRRWHWEVCLPTLEMN